jgi:hypothetical protein
MIGIHRIVQGIGIQTVFAADQFDFFFIAIVYRDPDYAVVFF